MNQLSPLAVRALVEAISGGQGNPNRPIEPVGIYRSGPDIGRFLADCNLDFQVIGSRVPELADFLRELSRQPEGQAALIRLVERVADPREYRQAPERCQLVIDHLNEAMDADGLEVVLDGKRARVREKGPAGTVVGSFAAKALTFDFDTVSREITRALDSAEHDPEDAVTAANAIVEAVCRSILIELGIELPAKKDIDGLVRAVQEPLDLSPGRTDLPAEITADVRQVLGGLTSAAKGGGALRTHAGDAHGRERGFKRIDARIARLAIHAASTIALFLIETWERKFKRGLPHAPSATGVA